MFAEPPPPSWGSNRLLPGSPPPGPCPPRAGGMAVLLAPVCPHLHAQWHGAVPRVPSSGPLDPAVYGSHSRAVEVRQVVADCPPAQVSSWCSPPPPTSPCLPTGRENVTCGPPAHDGGQVGLLWERPARYLCGRCSAASALALSHSTHGQAGSRVQCRSEELASLKPSWLRLRPTVAAPAPWGTWGLSVSSVPVQLQLAGSTFLPSTGGHCGCSSRGPQSSLAP